MSDDPAPRRVFHDEVYGRLLACSEGLFADVPELEGLALVPSWTVPQPRLQPGLLLGKEGPLTRPAEIMHMAVQLHRALHLQLEAAFGTLRFVDEEMGRMQEEIRAKQSELDQLDARLAEHRAADAPEGRSGGGAPSESAPAS